MPLFRNPTSVFPRRENSPLAAVALGGLLGLVMAGLPAVHDPQGLRAHNGSGPSDSADTPQKTTGLSLEERGDIFMARKSYADAVDYYYRALRASGFSQAEVWNKLGIAYQQQNNHRAARKAYNEAVRRRGDFAEAWNNIGTTYYLEYRFRKSLKYYRRAIELQPHMASFHLNLGTAYCRMKKYQDAVEQYRSALELDPNILTQHSSTGTVLQARGADAQYYFYLAKVYASLDRPGEAVRFLRRAFEDGFRDKSRLEQDPDFKKLNHYPPYADLLENPPVPIKE